MARHEKRRLSITFAELVYNGQWFTPLREALSAFVDKTQEKVTGYVRLKLYKGNIIKAGVDSPYSLYSEEIATFGESDYDQTDSAGFINLYGLPIKVQANNPLNRVQVNNLLNKKSVQRRLPCIRGVFYSENDPPEGGSFSVRGVLE
jgi:argininosuccinate synthase